MGLSCPRKTGDAAEITGKPAAPGGESGGRSLTVSGQVRYLLKNNDILY